MKRRRTLVIFSLILALTMSIGLFAGCNRQQSQMTKPLVVGYLPFSEKFSPFFADTGYDNEAVTMTQVSLLTTDRTGGIVYNAIKGETIPYEGKDYVYKGVADLDITYDEAADQTTYKWTLRNNVKFSDGEKLTADDVIFSYYVFCDPSYAGSTTLSSLPIIGLQNYRTQTSDEVYAKYEALFDTIYAAGEDHEWSSSDSWTKEQQDAVWAAIKERWLVDVQTIVTYVNSKYMGYAESYTGYTEGDIKGKEGMEIMLGMVLWGYGSIEDDGSLTAAVSGKTWDLKTTFPTVEEYFEEYYAAYEGDPVAYAGLESAVEADVYAEAKGLFIGSEGPKDPSLGGAGIPNITGIKKLSSSEVTITISGIDAAAVYRLGIQIAPLHYYGDKAKYDYNNNKFGFDFGDLSGVQSKTTQPMGAGPYRFIKYENKVIYFEANENYWRGQPKTYYVQFKEGADADKISGVSAGTIDVTDPSFGTAAVAEISSINTNGELVGNVIVTNTVDNLGYGYIGLNADTMNVGGDPRSEASKNLRKGIATMLAVYRDLTVDSYYGERASVINYPISNTSWAAPQKTDEGYKVAFSTAVDGTDIYASAMTADQRYTAALNAAIDYFKAAGFTFDEAGGKFTAAPAGAKLEYEIIIGGDGKGDHPSFVLCTKVAEAMATIGFNIIINDPTDTNVLWNKLDAGTQEMWCAAWGATIDPDMYQVYHSSGIVGRGGSDSNHYHVDDPELDELIIAARKSLDQAYRKLTYKACLDLIIDWAVEIPVYQRQNCIIFSAERVDMDTVTPDITTFWGWMNDIELLEMIVE